MEKKYQPRQYCIDTQLKYFYGESIDIDLVS